MLHTLRSFLHVSIQKQLHSSHPLSFVSQAGNSLTLSTPFPLCLKLETAFTLPTSFPLLFGPNTAFSFSVLCPIDHLATLSLTRPPKVPIINSSLLLIQTRLPIQTRLLLQLSPQTRLLLQLSPQTYLLPLIQSPKAMAAPTPHQVFTTQCQLLYNRVNNFTTGTGTDQISNALQRLQAIVDTYCNAVGTAANSRPIVYPHYISFPTQAHQNQYYQANPTNAAVERAVNDTHAQFNAYLTNGQHLPNLGLLFCLVSSLMTGGYHNPQTDWHTTCLIFDPTPGLPAPTPAYVFDPGLAQNAAPRFNNLSTAQPTPPAGIRVSNCGGGIRNLSLFTNLAPGNNADRIPGTHTFTITGDVPTAQLRCVAHSFRFLIRAVEAYLDPNPPAALTLEQRFSQGQGLGIQGFRWLRLRP